MRAKFINKKIKHLRYHTPEELAKIPDPPEPYDLLTDEQKTWFDKIVNGADEIKQLYRYKYYRNGGWNGMIDAINAYQDKKNIEMPEFDDEGFDIWKMIMDEIT